MDRREHLLEGRVCKDCVNTERGAINTITLQLQHVGFRILFMVYAHMKHHGQKKKQESVKRERKLGATPSHNSSILTLSQI